eukprot:scpid32010/ scgid20799/ 
MEDLQIDENFVAQQNALLSEYSDILKNCQVAAKHLEHHIRDCARLEEAHSREQQKIVRPLKSTSGYATELFDAYVTCNSDLGFRTASLYNKLLDIASGIGEYSSKLKDVLKPVKDEIIPSASESLAVVDSEMGHVEKVRASLAEADQQHQRATEALHRCREKDKSDKYEAKLKKALVALEANNADLARSSAKYWDAYNVYMERHTYLAVKVTEIEAYAAENLTMFISTYCNIRCSIYHEQAAFHFTCDERVQTITANAMERARRYCRTQPDNFAESQESEDAVSTTIATNEISPSASLGAATVATSASDCDRHYMVDSAPSDADLSLTKTSVVDAMARMSSTVSLEEDANVPERSTRTRRRRSKLPSLDRTAHYKTSSGGNAADQENGEGGGGGGSWTSSGTFRHKGRSTVRRKLKKMNNLLRPANKTTRKTAANAVDLKEGAEQEDSNIQVDSEGYSIQPDRQEVISGDVAFSSSSDDESDKEATPEILKGLKGIVIKPNSQRSAPTESENANSTLFEAATALTLVKKRCSSIGSASDVSDVVVTATSNQTVNTNCLGTTRPRRASVASDIVRTTDFASGSGSWRDSDSLEKSPQQAETFQQQHRAGLQIVDTDQHSLGENYGSSDRLHGELSRKGVLSPTNSSVSLKAAFAGDLSRSFSPFVSRRDTGLAYAMSSGGTSSVAANTDNRHPARCTGDTTTGLVTRSLEQGMVMVENQKQLSSAWSSQVNSFTSNNSSILSPKPVGNAWSSSSTPVVPQLSSTSPWGDSKADIGDNNDTCEESEGPLRCSFSAMSFSQTIASIEASNTPIALQTCLSDDARSSHSDSSMSPVPGIGAEMHGTGGRRDSYDIAPTTTAAAGASPKQEESGLKLPVSGFFAAEESNDMMTMEAFLEELGKEKTEAGKCPSSPLKSLTAKISESFSPITRAASAVVQSSRSRSAHRSLSSDSFKGQVPSSPNSMSNVPSFVTEGSIATSETSIATSETSIATNGTSIAGDDAPVPINPMPFNLVPISPVPINPVPTHPVSAHPVPFNPVPINPVPNHPVSTHPVPTHPVSINPMPCRTRSLGCGTVSDSPAAQNELTSLASPTREEADWPEHERRDSTATQTDHVEGLDSVSCAQDDLDDQDAFLSDVSTQMPTENQASPLSEPSSPDLASATTGEAVARYSASHAPVRSNTVMTECSVESLTSLNQVHLATDELDVVSKETPSSTENEEIPKSTLNEDIPRSTQNEEIARSTPNESSELAWVTARVGESQLAAIEGGVPPSSAENGRLEQESASNASPELASMVNAAPCGTESRDAVRAEDAPCHGESEVAATCVARSSEKKPCKECSTTRPLTVWPEVSMGASHSNTRVNSVASASTATRRPERIVLVNNPSTPQSAPPADVSQNASVPEATASVPCQPAGACVGAEASSEHWGRMVPSPVSTPDHTTGTALSRQSSLTPCDDQHVVEPFCVNVPVLAIVETISSIYTPSMSDIISELDGAVSIDIPQDLLLCAADTIMLSKFKLAGCRSVSNLIFNSLFSKRTSGDELQVNLRKIVSKIAREELEDTAVSELGRVVKLAYYNINLRNADVMPMRITGTFTPTKEGNVFIDVRYGLNPQSKVYRDVTELKIALIVPPGFAVIDASANALRDESTVKWSIETIKARRNSDVGQMKPITLMCHATMPEGSGASAMQGVADDLKWMIKFHYYTEGTLLSKLTGEVFDGIPDHALSVKKRVIVRGECLSETYRMPFFCFTLAAA